MVTRQEGGGGGGGSSGDGGGGKGQTPTLLQCSLKAMLRLLTSAVKRRRWQRDKAALTHIVHTHVPHNLRQELQSRVLLDWRLYDTVSLRLLEVLLSPSTTSLTLATVRAFYRDDLTLLLRDTLTGLTHLTIQDPGWVLSVRQVKQVSDALGQMTHLRVLVLQYCAQDQLITAIATGCPFIQVLDVRGSRGVSDEGVWSLVTLSSSLWSGLNTPDHGDTEGNTHGKHSLFTCWRATIKALTSRMMALRIFGYQKYTLSPDDDNTSQQAPEHLSIETLEVHQVPGAKTPEVHQVHGARETGVVVVDEKRLPWCSFLTHLDLRGTGVSREGVGLLALTLPAITTLHHDPHIHSQNTHR